MDELLKEILDDLKIELGLTEESDVALLTSKIKSAAREVRILRNFPDSFTEEQILKDMKNGISISVDWLCMTSTRLEWRDRVLTARMEPPGHGKTGRSA